ncbi:MAG: type II toxin-antitoxin system VapC family toxin [Kiritimatiellia bacterium]
MIIYLDTSAVLRVLLNQQEASSHWGKWGKAYVSELMRTEFFRTLDRLRLQAHIDDTDRAQVARDFETFWITCYRVPLSRQILKRAADPFPTVLGSLDAIHLSTALMVESSENIRVHLLTHDQQLARAALASGVSVL